MNVTPKTTKQAEQALLQAYEAATGEAPGESAKLICRISAARAMEEPWRWESSRYPGFAVLVWGPKPS